MGAHRSAEASLSKPDWMVIPENDLSDVFIGRREHQTWSSHQSPTLTTRHRPRNGRKSLMTIFVEEHSQAFKDHSNIFTKHRQGNDLGPDENHDKKSKHSFHSLTSQILSEIHGRGKSTPKQHVSSVSSQRFKLQSLDRRTKPPPSRNKASKQLVDPFPKSNSALNFSQRSLALNLVRTRSALSQHSAFESGSLREDHKLPVYSPFSDGSVSSRETYSVNQDIAAKQKEGARKRQSPRLSYGSSVTAKDGPDTTQETPSSPDALEHDHFGSHDSGISNPDLCPLEKTPQHAQEVSSKTREQLPRKRYASGGMGLMSSKDTIFELSESGYPKALREVDDTDDDDNSDNDKDNVFPVEQKTSPTIPVTAVHRNRGEDEEEEEDDELPEYLDSFQAASTVAYRRSSLWNRVRDLGASALIQDFSSTRTTSSLGNSVTSGIGAASIHSNDTYDIDTRQRSKNKLCPNCGEELQRAPTRFVAVKGNERNFLSWLLGHWGKVGSL